MRFVTWLDRYYFDKHILDVAIATLERGGVTSKMDTYQFLTSVDAWGVPKHPGKTVILMPDANIVEGLTQFIQNNEELLYEPDAWLGTWINPRTSCCYLDITVICLSFEEAKREALRRSRQERRDVLALYNFKCGETVYIESELVV